MNNIKDCPRLASAQTQLVIGDDAAHGLDTLTWMLRNATVKYLVEVTLTALTLLILNSCGLGNKKNEGFYDYSKEFDSYRIPLIEPIEIYSSDKVTWIGKLPYNQINGMEEIGGEIEKVGINKSIIVIYTPSTYIFDSMNQAWFVIDVNKKTEKAFIEESEYLKYLRQEGTDQINLYEVNEVYRMFDTENKLPSEWGHQPTTN
ncbi:MAG TPA: hypothetical protein VE978_13910 [Chitinophagales bacterium]|nr:hypothetical protein [Chitinophagales bacterium]